MPRPSYAENQCAEILAYLSAGNGLTSLEAQDKFACMRLASRINDLRQDGHAIESVWHSNGLGKRWVEYRLAA